MLRASPSPMFPAFGGLIMKRKYIGYENIYIIYIFISQYTYRKGRSLLEFRIQLYSSEADGGSEESSWWASAAELPKQRYSRICIRLDDIGWTFGVWFDYNEYNMCGRSWQDICVVFEHIRRDCVVIRLADCPTFPWRPRICAWALRDSILLALWSVARSFCATSKVRKYELANQVNNWDRLVWWQRTGILSASITSAHKRRTNNLESQVQGRKISCSSDVGPLQVRGEQIEWRQCTQWTSENETWNKNQRNVMAKSTQAQRFQEARSSLEWNLM